VAAFNADVFLPSAFLPAYRASVGVASYAYNGVSAGVARGLKVNSNLSSYLSTGAAAALHATRTVSLYPSLVALTGENLTFSAAYVVPSLIGVYNSTGYGATSVVTRRLTASPGFQDFVGYASGVPRGLKLRGFTQPYTLSGIDYLLITTRKFWVTLGSYSQNGDSNPLRIGRQLYPVKGIYADTEITSRLVFGRRVTAANSSFSLNGSTATFRQDYRAYVGGKQFYVNPPTVILRKGYKRYSSGGEFTVQSVARRVYFSSFFYQDYEVVYVPDEVRALLLQRVTYDGYMKVIVEHNNLYTSGEDTTSTVDYEPRLMYVSEVVSSADEIIHSEPRSRVVA
jgi:hypothetical protein